MAGPSQTFNFGFSLNEEDPGFINLNQEEGTEVQSSNPQIDTTKKKRKTRLTSLVWDHFTKVNVPCPRGGTEEKAQCNYCKDLLSSKSSNGTGHLTRHMKNHLAPKENEGSSRGRGRGMIQTQISRTDSSGGLGVSNYDPNNARYQLIKYIICSQQPFLLSEDRYFDRFIRNAFNAGWQKISRNTARSDAIKTFFKEKENLKQVFENIPGKLGLTSDLWTSKQNVGYIAITSHYIDSDWVMQKRMLAFSRLEFPHTGSRIGTTILEKLREYKLENKIISITLDNASNNNVAVDLLKQSIQFDLNGDLFHNRCACHIINLIVQVGVKSIRDDLESIKWIVGYIFYSPS